MDNNKKVISMLEAERDIIKNLSQSQRYRYFLGRMQYIRYESGRENLFSSDCSGSVCLALLLATGFGIRVTADQLYRNYFTKKFFTDDDIQAVFFITENTVKTGYKVYYQGQCAHVAGICGRDVVLNCTEPYSVLRSLSGMKDFYSRNGYRAVVRGLNMKALKKSHCLDRDIYDPDRDFSLIRDSFMSSQFRRVA